MDDNWQAAQARAHFAELVAAAGGGKPQFTRRRDGNEVVLVSRAYFDRTKMSLKDYLLSAGYAGEEPDAFDEAMRTVRGSLPPLAPGSCGHKGGGVFILDTDVVSNLRRRQPNTALLQWIEAVGWAELAATVTTVMEITFGIEEARRSNP